MPDRERAIRGRASLVAVDLEDLQRRDLIPRYPSVAQLRPVKIPAPPRPPSNATPAQLATLMARAYRTAFTAVFRQSTYAYARGVSANSDSGRMLLEGARALAEQSAAPLAWAGWSCKIWRDYMGKGTAPAKWVFNPTRIEDHHSWYAREGGNTLGGKLIFTPTHLDLLRRWASLRADLLRGGFPTEEKVRAITTRHFPGTMYEDLIERARDEIFAEEETLAARVRRGQWVW